MIPSSLSIYVVFMVLSCGIYTSYSKRYIDVAYRSANKDKHTCNECIVKSTNGSRENQGIQSNQGVQVNLI